MISGRGESLDFQTDFGGSQAAASKESTKSCWRFTEISD
jgi:hypothetical protein